MHGMAIKVAFVAPGAMEYPLMEQQRRAWFTTNHITDGQIIIIGLD